MQEDAVRYLRALPDVDQVQVGEQSTSILVVQLRPAAAILRRGRA